jgi:hypothetical protein
MTFTSDKIVHEFNWEVVVTVGSDPLPLLFVNLLVAHANSDTSPRPGCTRCHVFGRDMTWVPGSASRPLNAISPLTSFDELQNG